MPVSIDAEGFAGQFVPREEARVSIAGQARFSGCVAFALEPRADAQRLLPAELELADCGAKCGRLHPLVFVFGDLSEGATLFGGLTLPLGVAYREFALLVPFVRQRGDSRLHSFVPRMYSSYLPAIWNGNYFYGLAKQMAEMAWRGRGFEISRGSGEPMFRAERRGDPPWPREPPPELAALRALLRLPVLGRRSSGALVRSWFDWDFAAVRARLCPLQLEVRASLADGLRPGRYEALESRSFELAGALWRLSFPTPAGRAALAPRAPLGGRPLR